jgi:asparagine synthase (glutamine-hydrolysing)
MCGFCGFALRDGAVEALGARLSAMTRTLAHRGPDDQGEYLREGIAVGFRRLSIIDLDGGHQPIWNEEGNVAVVCNGEIYNFKELREELQKRGHHFSTGSDAETVVHLYEEKGEALFGDLVGMYAICLADFRIPGAPRLLLARDRIGIKPMYWGATDGGIYWGSEPKAILESGVFDRRLRDTALVDYLVQGYTSGPRSAWSGISRLEPGHWLEWTRERGVRVQRYWDLPLEERPESAPAEEILDWIDRIVGDRLVADVPLGAFLSGGIDSTAVVTSMVGASAEQVVACSVGFAEKSHDELERARGTARRLGLVHHTSILQPDPTLALEVLPWFYDEPLADSSCVPTYLVSKMARENVTVALSGDGGDEIFGGYRRYVYDVAENRLRRTLGPLGRKGLATLGRFYPKLDAAPRWLRAKSVLENFGRDPARAYYASLTQLSTEEAFAVLAPDLRESLRDHDPFEAFQEHYDRPCDCDPLYRAQYADFKTFLPDQILVKTDRASMAVSLEVRVPLLDHRFVERFAALPRNEKVRGGRGKHALREALRSRIPGEVLDGPKMGFDTPLRGWIRGPLADAVSESVESLPEDWFDRGALRTRFSEHRAGHRDHSALLWSLLVLEQWRRCHRATGIAAG